MDYEVNGFLHESRGPRPSRAPDRFSHSGGIAVLRLGKPRPVLLCGVAFRESRARRWFWPCERQLHKRRVSVPRAATSSLIWFANSCAEINTELSPR